MTVAFSVESTPLGDWSRSQESLPHPARCFPDIRTMDSLSPPDFSLFL
ncbi:hypothetical protein SLEP1_g46507 [Rubroshorea leprosula]|uniref:Uncharacterized protein n=1 Tax=Rubroshorea leprosula TaxID=152421 RepID=A0AAV5LMG3_9ROSI|nr:hypothetical protein SLEP1_g46507 [Rubroshorea leprosula]